ncbi:MAG: ABC transporter ATP-binding protein [Eubacteriales bacterium]
MSFLKVENLQKYFKEIRAVDNISFQLEKGDILGLLGPNGAGKSTTIAMIATLIKPDSGNIFYEGENITKSPKSIQKKLGYIPQEIALYPTLSGRENLQFWGRAYGLRGKELKNRIEKVSEIIGIDYRLKDKVDKYSGGMKRRINIGVALLHKPELVIMDEPTVGIDPQSRKHILDTVIKLNKQGMTVIYTSHYMEEVEYLCNKICIMDHGNIIAEGTQKQLIDMINDKKQQEIKVDSSSYSDIKKLNIKEPNLEAVFLHLTGRGLRD